MHGIPGDRMIMPGDVVSIDCGAIIEGWHGDAAFSIVVDPIDSADQKCWMFAKYLCGTVLRLENVAAS